MKKVQVTLQVVVDLDVSNDTDLDEMERFIAERPVRFLTNEHPGDMTINVAVEAVEAQIGSSAGWDTLWGEAR